MFNKRIKDVIKIERNFFCHLIINFSTIKILIVIIIKKS